MPLPAPTAPAAALGAPPPGPRRGPLAALRRLAPVLLAGALLPAACETTGGGSTAPTPGGRASYLETEDGALLHYRLVGTKGPVLVVPGACWTEGDMAGGQGGDALSGHRVLFYDLRGRGRSDALPEPLAPSLGSDLADLEELRAWFGFERISLLATDYQAAVAAHYAAAHPERVERLVLVSPVPVRRTPYLKIYERVFNDRLDDEKFVELREAHVRMVNRRDPEQWARLYRDALFSGWVRDERSLDRWYSSPFVPPNADPERMIRQYMRSLETAGDWDWRPVLQRVAAPTLLIVGDDDPMPPESTREWYANLPDGRLEVISRSGRLPWVEQPGSFYSRVRSFLEGKR